MAAAANAAAAAALGIEEPGARELTTTESLEPVSSAGPAAAPEPLHSTADASQAAAQPGVDPGASAAEQLAQSKVAEPSAGGASLGPSTSAPAGADDASLAETGDQQMQDASQAAAEADAPQSSEQLTQAYPAAPTEEDGARVEQQDANTAASMAQRAEHVSTATAPPSTAQPDGKPLVAGSAIFTKVSPMKGKVGLLTMPACMHLSFKRAFKGVQRPGLCDLALAQRNVMLPSEWHA